MSFFQGFNCMQETVFLGRERNCLLERCPHFLGVLREVFHCMRHREVFMEKHWSSVVSRSVCDYFFEAQSKATSAADIPPVISTPHYYLVSIFRNHLYFVAVLQNEGTYKYPPLPSSPFLSPHHIRWWWIYH